MPIQLPIYLDDENSFSTHYNPFIGVNYNNKIKFQDSSMKLQKIKRRLLHYASKPIMRIPLLNWLIMISLSFMLIKLTFHYHRLYTKSSIVATCLTNIVLYAISDTLAQSIASYKGKSLEFPITDPLDDDDDDDDDVEQQQQQQGRVGGRSRSRSGSNSSSVFVDYGDDSIGLNNLDPGFNNVRAFHHHSNKKNQIFDFYRFFGFVFWGFFMAFIQVGWYLFLHSMYLDLPRVVSACARVITDQLCFSPISLYAFFTYSTFILESGTKKDLYEKIKNIYLNTLIANFIVWIPVQFINFLIMPRNLQVPFSSSIGVLWNCFLSMKNAANSANTT